MEPNKILDLLRKSSKPMAIAELSKQLNIEPKSVYLFLESNAAKQFVTRITCEDCYRYQYRDSNS